MSQGDPNAASPSNQVLAWMHGEFTALRSMIDDLTDRSAMEQGYVRELAENTSSELAVSLAQMEGYAAELRNETARLASFQDELTERLPELIASAITPLIRASVTDPLPGLVGEAVRPEVRDALADLRHAMSGFTTTPASGEWTATVRADLARMVSDAVSVAVATALARVGPAPGQAPLVWAVESPDRLTPPTARAHGSYDAARAPVSRIAASPDISAGPSLAAPMMAAVDNARLRVRRWRRAGVPASGIRHSDPFLGPAMRLLARIDANAQTGADPGRGRAAVNELTVNELAVGELAVGDRDGQEVSIDLAGWPGLVLGGPGAAGAARSAVLSFVARHGHEVAQAVVVGGLLPALPTLPGLVQMSDPGRAVDDFAAEIARRRPTPDRPFSHDVTSGYPTLLLVVVDPPPAELARLSWLAEEGARLGALALMVCAQAAERGQVGEGALAWVAVGGEVTSARPEELSRHLEGTTLFRLTAAAAAELLTVLGAARTDADLFRWARRGNESFDIVAPAATAATPVLQIRALGGLALLADGTDKTAELSPKALELVAYLLIHPRGADPQAAGEAIWPLAGIDHRGRLDEELETIRRHLNPLWPGGVDVLDQAQGRLRLESVVDSDLWDLQRALAQGRGETASVGVGGFERSAALYRGELFAGYDWWWAQGARDDLRQRMVDALVWLADSLWAAGNADEAGRRLAQAIDVDPFAEQLYRRQMRLQIRQGHANQVDHTFERLVEVLATAGLEPNRETEKLRVELLQG